MNSINTLNLTAAALDRFRDVFAGGDQAHGLWDIQHGAKTRKVPATEDD